LVRVAAEKRRDHGLRRAARSLALAFVVLGSLDVVSTNAALAAGYIEGNPFVRILHAEFGTWWLVPKLAAHVLLASFVLWLPSRRILWGAGALIAFYLTVVTHNFILAY
jgi:hypothetical protein